MVMVNHASIQAISYLKTLPVRSRSRRARPARIEGGGKIAARKIPEVFLEVNPAALRRAAKGKERAGAKAFQVAVSGARLAKEGERPGEAA